MLLDAYKFAHRCLFAASWILNAYVIKSTACLGCAEIKIDIKMKKASVSILWTLACKFLGEMQIFVEVHDSSYSPEPFNSKVRLIYCPKIACCKLAGTCALISSGPCDCHLMSSPHKRTLPH